MSFLTPWFVIAGVAAISLPILFHFFRRTPRGRMPFSTLMFLTPSPPRLTSRNRLENLPLLLLRAAVFALLAIAFGRPFLRQLLEQQQNVPVGQRTVLLLDRSASMRRGDLWQKAVQEIEKAADQASPYDELALVTFDKRPESLVSFESWRSAPIPERAGLVRAALTGIEPGWSATHLDDALTSSAEMLDAADQDKSGTRVERAKKIFLVSDLQSGSRLLGLQNYEWPKRIEVELNSIASSKTNAGLHPLNASDETTQANSASARPRVIVTNAANSTRESFELAWVTKAPPAAQGESLAKKESVQPDTPKEEPENSPASPPADNRPLQVYVPPGQSRVVRTPPLPPGDVAQLTLRGDDEVFDNHLWFIPPTREQLRVLHLSAEKSEDPNSLRYFLERAFAGAAAGRLVTVETVDPHAAEVRVPTERDLAAVQLVVMGKDAELPEAWNTALQTWTTAGGTVLAVIGSANSNGWRGFLPAPLAEVGHISLAEVGGDNQYALLSEIDLRHPIFQPFADPRYSDFTKIHFWRHRQLKLDEVAAKAFKIVAKFDSGDPALLELLHGTGRILLLTSGWQPRESQLGVSSKFVPLMAMLVEMGWRNPPTSASYDAGETIDLARLGPAVQDSREADNKEPEKKSTRVTGPWTVTLPDGKQRIIAADTPSLELSAGPGVYEVRSATGRQRIAVNVPADESKTMPLFPEALETLGVQLKKEQVAEPPQTLEEKQTLQSRELESRQQLWRWCLVAGLAVVVGETWFAGYIARRESVS